MDFADKILDAAQLQDWRQRLRASGHVLVATNGCFDILHVGHVTYLQQARAQGHALLVGVTSDAGTRWLKGPGRPVNSEADRAAVLGALESVNAVYVFPESDASAFLQLAQPDVYVKGGDYTLETINQSERRLLEGMGAKIVILPMVPGKSTTAILAKQNNLTTAENEATSSSMPSESFQASRWTSGNFLFPTVIEVTDKAVIRHKRSWFQSDDMSFTMNKVASVHIHTGMFWSNILIESSGGTDPIESHGHRKADARRIKELIEGYQQGVPPAAA